MELYINLYNNFKPVFTKRYFLFINYSNFLTDYIFCSVKIRILENKNPLLTFYKYYKCYNI